MVHLPPSFSPRAIAGRGIAHHDFSQPRANCSADCAAFPCSPALTRRDQRIATLVLLSDDYMELAWHFAKASDAAEFSIWIAEVERTERELTALCAEAARV
jgi:hypothetical protein